MTGDSRTPEQVPRKPLSAPQSPEHPIVGISGGAGGLSGPQAGADGLGPRDVIRDAIARTIRDGRYWLPADGQQAVADAVLATRDQEMEQLRTRVDLAHKARRALVGYLDEVRVHLIRHGIDPEHLRHDGDVPIRLQELLDPQQPTA